MKEKQELDRRDTYTARDAHHVRISVELQSCITGLVLRIPAINIYNIENQSL